ncbi:MAG: DUF547 domain-containing protein [Pseudomonadota bacterium]
MPAFLPLPKPGLAVSLIALATAALAVQPAHARAEVEPQFATFVPGDTPNNDKIDYSIWTEAMQNLVISMGPSLRQGAGRPDPSFGTRRQYGHVSRYRLEGTRVMFSFFDAPVKESFSEYRRDLEETASKVDIQSLSRNEQLAYWINLHNVALVEQISQNWPVRQPRDLKIDGVPLDDAKFITVEGVKLSPRDIREKIVFQNWKDPLVIYGFWRGDIGGPSIQKEAFSAENMGRLLERGARDFVNSLRGTEKSGKRLEVSKLYEEAAPFFFPDFEKDVRAHMTQYANPEVKDILANTTTIRASISEYDIADLAGGIREPSLVPVETVGQGFQSTRIPQSMARLLAQRERKFLKILREGRTGTVTFSNINLPGDPEDKGEIE